MDNKIINHWRESNKSQRIEVQKLCNLSSIIAGSFGVEFLFEIPTYKLIDSTILSRYSQNSREIKWKDSSILLECNYVSQ